MFVRLVNNVILEDITDILPSSAGFILVKGNENIEIASNELLIISNIYPSKDMIECIPILRKELN